MAQTTINIEEIYIEFHDILLSVYHKNTDYMDSQEQLKLLEKHMAQFSQILGALVEEKASDLMISAWTQQTFKQIINFEKDKNNWDLNSVLDKNITTALEDSTHFFEHYKKYFLPLQEKMLLQTSIASKFHGDTPKPNKI